MFPAWLGFFPNQSLINFQPIWGFVSCDATPRCSLLEIDTNLVRCGKHAATKEIVSLATRNLLTTLHTEPTLTPLAGVAFPGFWLFFAAVQSRCRGPNCALIILMKGGADEPPPAASQLWDLQRRINV